MKKSAISLLSLSALLVGCFSTPIQYSAFYFDTAITATFYDCTNEEKNYIDNYLSVYSKISDNYGLTDMVNVYSINHTTEDIQISGLLYDLLETAMNMTRFDNYFNPFSGSLNKLWKAAIERGEVLSDDVIQVELEKMNNTTLIFKDNHKVQKIGEAEIDLGAIAKGYALQFVKENFLDAKSRKKYIINAGNSSILLGEKNTKDGLFRVKLPLIDNSYLKMKNCFISTSGIYEQGKEIDSTYYSHIINPLTGSAVSKYQYVIVITNNGYLGDVLSTAFMNNTLEEIKEYEELYDVQTIVINDNKIVYNNENIEVLHG